MNLALKWLYQPFKSKHTTSNMAEYKNYLATAHLFGAYW